MTSKIHSEIFWPLLTHGWFPWICSSPALTQKQSNAKNIYVSNRSYSILRWLMIIKLNLWVKKAICSVKAFAPHMSFVIRQKVMDTTVKTYLYEPFFIVILKRCLYTVMSVRSWNFKDGASLKASFLPKNQHAERKFWYQLLWTTYDT